MIGTSLSISTTICKHQLRWIGHVVRMPDTRLPKQVLYSELATGQRAPGGQKKRFKDHLKTLLKQCNISPTALESLAADRKIWSSTCHQGIAHLQGQAAARRIHRRAQRHQRAAGLTPPQDVLTCPSCGKTCGSRIGLHSHMSMHRRNAPQ